MSRNPLPFRYPGGKFYALDILSPFWSSVEHEEYREPFAGGATVFFNKPKKEVCWLNDLDSELMCTYRILQDSVLRDRLAQELAKETASPERWREVFDSKPKSDYEIAYKYYYMNRTSFSGKMVSPAWGYREKRSLPPERWGERIYPCGAYLEGVKLTNIDFADCILADSANRKVLMYVDPPYFAPPKKKHYRHGFTLDDHVRLADTLKKTKHSFFLTYDDVPEVRQLYSWANVNSVNFIYRVDNSQVKKGQRALGFELVITNYDIPREMSLPFM